VVAIAWIGLVVGVGAVVYAFRMRQQLCHYRDTIRRLKERQHVLESDLADGERLDALLVSMNEVVFRLNGSGMVVAANARAKAQFSMQGMDYPISLRQLHRDTDWHDLFKKALQLLPEHTCLPDITLSDVTLAPRIAVLNAGHMLLMCVDVSEQRRLERQRSTFLSNLMHDLKTPLTSLLGYARSLKSFGEDAEFRIEAVHVIADEAKHVNHLLDELLTLDQIEFSARNEHAACFTSAVLDRVCKMLRSVCVEKHIELLCDYGSNDTTLAIADDELERIVTNLLSNALNYSPTYSKVQLTLMVMGSRCSIVIEDQGEGIPEQEISRVTERFYRVDKARTRKHGGHGLGLAIVKELAEKNSGELKLSNRSDYANASPSGLRAEVILPLAVR